MSKYLSDECQGCDEHIEPYGCTNHNCEIYKAIQSYHADMEHDRRKDYAMESRVNPIFDNILDVIKGDF